MRNADKGRCSLGKPYFPTKRDAENACGDRERPERCGRCRGWHPMPVKGKR